MLIATYDRPELLRSLPRVVRDQTLDRSEYEVVVIDDGSDGDDLASGRSTSSRDELQVVGLRIEHAGRSAAKNHAVLLARAPIVLFFDDDDRAAPDYLERHLAGHAAKPGEAVAILGHTDWAPELEPTPLMHYITDVDRLMFAYERLGDGQELDWRGFWEGRISCKRSLLVRHGLHDQRLGYSIDVEMGWRLAPFGLRVIYDSSARSLMARPIDFDAFCDRTEAKGRAHAIIAALHPGTEIATRLAARRRGEALGGEAPHRARPARAASPTLEAASQTDAVRAPRPARGVPRDVPPAARQGRRRARPKGCTAMSDPPTTVHPVPEHRSRSSSTTARRPDADVEPLLSITIPVWSRTPELAEMARRTIERIWEVARIPTEVVVVDNGSPYEIPLPAKVYRYPENRGVSTGWNTGIRLSTAPVVVVLNSDCRVEPGWDEALYEAATDGRRVAFPYTDHCDGLGFTRPDQGGTAGWCFMISKAHLRRGRRLRRVVQPRVLRGHRLLAPRLAARASSSPRSPRRRSCTRAARREHRPACRPAPPGAIATSTAGSTASIPHRAPPYYNREITDYVGTFRVPDPERASAPPPGRPAAVFGIGLNKTGTTSLHEALTILGYESLHWGGPAIRRLVEASLGRRRAAALRLDPALRRVLRHPGAVDRTSSCSTSSTRAAASCSRCGRSTTGSTAGGVTSSRTSAARRPASTTATSSTSTSAAWRAEWDAHVGAVREHFAGRPTTSSRSTSLRRPSGAAVPAAGRSRNPRSRSRMPTVGAYRGAMTIQPLRAISTRSGRAHARILNTRS